MKARVELPAMAPAAKPRKLTLEIPALLLEGDDAPAARPSGPGSRYALGLPAAPATASADDLVLPESYGTRKVWLVPRDPQWLYAHWDLDASQQLEYNQLSRDGHLVLRVYDSATPAEVVTEVHVHPESRSWFAHVGKGGGSYFAVLGFRDKTGEWNEISRSGAVGTPPDSLSATVEAQFVSLPDNLPAEEIAQAQPADAAKPADASPPPLPPPAEPALPPVETLAEVIEAVREYLAAESTFTQALEQIAVGDHPGAKPPLELPPREEFVHWTPEQQHALAEVISMEAVRRVWAGGQPTSISADQQEAARRARDLASAAAVPVGAAGPAAVLAAGAITSPPGGRPKARSFWFNINAELIIYGATEPNASVVIGDRPIKLRKDGTFSYRFALPDGLYGLPVSATSADRVETRYAALRFMRETSYGGEVGTHPQDAALKPPGPEHTS